MKSFSSTIEIIGVNPYVLLPEKVLASLFKSAGRDKGPIPVKIKVDGHAFTQTLVKYRGHWRLYINGPMLKATGKDVGRSIKVHIEFDAKPPETMMPPALEEALAKNAKARKAFEAFPPSRRKEIMRYIGFLKSEESIKKNVEKAISHLLGKGRFVGRN